MLAKECEAYRCKEFTSIYKLLSLEGKKALVTGGAGGIGRSTVKAFAELGADVALMDIPSKLTDVQRICDEIKDKYPVNAVAVTGDVADEASVKEFVAQTVEAFGTIHILHSNAGIVLPGDNPNAPIDGWNKVLGVNLTGMMLVCRTVANVMIEHQHGGAIINTASKSAHIISGNGFSYAATKAAVIHMTKAMAAQYVPYGIRVNSISPGVVLSGIHDNVPVEGMEHMLGLIPMKRFGTLDEIAGWVAVLASDVAGFMTGSDILVDGGQCIY